MWKVGAASVVLAVSGGIVHAEKSDRKLLWKYSSGKSDKLKLRFVQVIHRHGARTPIIRLDGEDFDELYAPCFGVDDRDMVVRDTCHRGMLTDVGRKQMEALGRDLRERYADILPAAFSPEAFYLRSTDVPRTRASLRSLLSGMYPGVLAEAAPFHVRDIREEDMFPNVKGCERLVETFLAHRAFLEVTHPTFREACNRTGGECRDSVFYERNTSWVKIADIGKCRRAQGLALPEGLNDQMHQQAEEEAFRVATTVTGSESALRLGMGRFLKGLLREAREAVRGDKKEVMAIYSGHDTSVLPILEALDRTPAKWPPFASYVALEYLEDPASRDLSGVGRFYVRLIYNGRVEGIIPIEEFEAAMNRRIPLDYYSECKRQGKFSPGRFSW